MILWVITGLFMMGISAGQGFFRDAVYRPYLVPDLDLLLVLLVGLFARPGRVTPLLLLLAGSRSILAGTPLAAAVGSFLLVGWFLRHSRHLLFRNRLPGRLAFSFFGVILLRFCLALLAHLGQAVPWPPVHLWLVPATVTALWAVILVPILCYVPPLSFHVERSRV